MLRRCVSRAGRTKRFLRRPKLAGLGKPAEQPPAQKCELNTGEVRDAPHRDRRWKAADSTKQTQSNSAH